MVRWLIQILAIPSHSASIATAKGCSPADGANYRLTPQLTLTLAPVVTRGYESSQRDVQIEGMGLLSAVNYRVAEGPLSGMNIFLAADKGREKRDGSSLGDRLNYWDVKMSIQYDFMLR